MSMHNDSVKEVQLFC